MPGEASQPRSFSQGKIVFTITIQGVKDPLVYKLETYTCNDYTVTINKDNSVGSSGTPVNKKII